MMIFSGTPNLAIQPLKKTSATVSVFIYSIGNSSGHEVHLSMQVRRYKLPLLDDNGPIKSI